MRLSPLGCRQAKGRARLPTGPFCWQPAKRKTQVSIRQGTDFLPTNYFREPFFLPQRALSTYALSGRSRKGSKKRAEWQKFKEAEKRYNALKKKELYLYHCAVRLLLGSLSLIRIFSVISDYIFCFSSCLSVFVARIRALQL